ncbi:MAG: hypothetical protein AB7P20_03790 [Rhizobiaceae bacterium]
MGQRIFMRVGVLAFGIAFLAGGAAQASSIITMEEPRPASPSIIEVGPPAISAATAEHVAVTSGDSLELAALDPLNMLPAGSNSVVRMEALTPSIVAVIAPDPNISNEIVAAIDGRKPRPNPLPMVMRGGIVGDPFLPHIELGKALEKLPEKVADKEPAQAAAPVDPDAINKPQLTETGAPMPANGAAVAGGQPRRRALR